MKFLVFCVFVIANISNNGKASLDSFSSLNSGIQFEDTTYKDQTSCYRPCKLNVKPRRCYFHFKVEPSYKDGKEQLTINGISPGPSIHVCLNDIVVVTVQNKIQDQDLTIHWHGIEHRETPFMDGTPMVTQCPIAYGLSYKYAFIATEPGTFFYHADSVLHQSDGVYGALVVNQPQPLEPFSTLYDYDRSKEHTLIVGVKFHGLLTRNIDVNEAIPRELVATEEASHKLSGFSYRMRFINAIAINCPILMSIDKHSMLIIANDGRPVKPMVARTVRIEPGERMDVVVTTGEEHVQVDSWVRVRGTVACAGLETRSVFLLSRFNNTLQADINEIKFDEESIPVSGQMLKSFYELEDVNVQTGQSVYLGIRRNIINYDNYAHDFQYTMDSVPRRPFVPASLAFNESRVIQINNKSFLYPSALYLLNKNNPNDVICDVEDTEVKDPQCVQVQRANIGETVELALVNEDSESYTFHMHGYGMQVVATGQKDDGLPLSKKVFAEMDANNEILRNLKNPPIKDTIVVPSKGYTIVRIQPEYGGSWLLECRSCGLYSLPTALIIDVPLVLPKAVIHSLPKCGTYKPPDVLLN